VANILLSLSNPSPIKTVEKVNSLGGETAVFQQRQLKHLWAPPLNSKPTKRVHFHQDIITTAQRQQQQATILNRKRKINFANPAVATHNTTTYNHINNNNNKGANIYVFPTSRLTTSPSSSQVVTDQKLLTLIAPAPLISKLNEWKMQYNRLKSSSLMGNPDLTKATMKVAAVRMMPPPPSRPKSHVQNQQ